MPSETPRETVLGRGSWSETARVITILRKETVGGAIVLAATVIALIWANSPGADAYHALRDFRIGPERLHLNLSLGAWAADGLLAIFFFVVGLELKREFVAGDLRSPRRAALPILAAMGGMVVPALIYVAVNLGGEGALRGWAIPTATDIAFAMAVLAIVGTHLPAALRTFLLTLAVVDDLLAIIIIAVFYTSDLELPALVAALVPLALFAIAVQRRIRTWWVLLPLAVLTWLLVHESGIHATIAGVLLGFTVPVRRGGGHREPDHSGMAEHLEHLLRPISAGVAVPVFAFLAAGVTLGGWGGFSSALSDRVTIGVIVGLVAGKSLGIFGATYLLTRLTRIELDAGLTWAEVLGLSLLAGIGFTVSLLIGDLAFGASSLHDDHVKVGVLMGSVVAAILAAVILRTRNRAYQRLRAEEEVDADRNTVPDVFE
ncbi:MAG: Na+/H+ antiporter NhaA [Dehalococcoidia bacterium]|nr:Na+/H+ antiporter NhaA [Dehalococcoidia bacterium]